MQYLAYVIDNFLLDSRFVWAKYSNVTGNLKEGRALISGRGNG
jgi:hypothetical protein